MENIVIYGSDVADRGNHCGPETRECCKEALSFIQKNQSQSFVLLLGAGKQTDRQLSPLKDLMNYYLVTQLTILGYHRREDKIFVKEDQEIEIKIANEDAWQIFNQTKSIVKMMQDFPVSETVICISPSHHQWPISLAWMFFSQYRLNRISFKKSFNPIVYVKEFVQACVVILQGIIYRLSFI